mmetsp:Transcript_15352/g.39074  ORF Transcript_15352/g.39074 Transcript_15352/m.39074 type:complete len:326 (+) Transcript_15352:2147-3124(+)
MVSRMAAKQTAGGMALTASCSSICVWRFLSVLRALEATVRASGSESSVERRSMAGMSSGRKGLASRESSMSLDMLSTMTATLRLISVFFSWHPRRRMGTVMARAGASTDCTKTVAESLCTVSGTSSGDWMALMSSGQKGLMSLFSHVWRAYSSVLAAADLTWALVSHIASEMTGTATGSVLEKAKPCFSASWPRRASDHILICHLVSLMPTKSISSTGRMAHGQQMVMRAGPASSASARTSAFLCAKASRILGRKGMTMGSTTVPATRASDSMVMRPFSIVLLSSRSLVMASTAPASVSTLGPAFFTTCERSSAVNLAMSLASSP